MKPKKVLSPEHLAKMNAGRKKAAEAKKAALASSMPVAEAPVAVAEAPVAVAEAPVALPEAPVALPEAPVAPEASESIAFSALVKSKWIEMAASAGAKYAEMVRLDGVDKNNKNAMKRAEAAWTKMANELGATYKAALYETSKNKRALVGKAPPSDAERAGWRLAAAKKAAAAPVAA